jgi:hypothetical protein
MDKEIKVTEIVLQIGEKTFKMTPAEARKLKSELDDIFGPPPTFWPYTTVWGNYPYWGKTTYPQYYAEIKNTCSAEVTR